MEKAEIDTDLSLSQSWSYSIDKAWVGQNKWSIENTFAAQDVFSIFNINNLRLPNQTTKGNMSSALSIMTVAQQLLGFIVYFIKMNKILFDRTQRK